MNQWPMSHALIVDVKDHGGCRSTQLSNIQSASAMLNSQLQRDHLTHINPQTPVKP